MKMKSMVIGWFLFCVAIIQAQDVGTLTQSKAVQGPVVKTIFAWTSGTNNNSVAGTGSVYVRGELLRVVFVPNATTGPSADYTATVKDESGIDLLGGQGAGVASNVTTTIRPGIAIVGYAVTNLAAFAINDLLTVAVTNCGNSTSGQIILYTR